MYDLENLENELKSKNTFSYLKIREKTIFNLNDTKIFSGECISDPRYGSNHGSYVRWYLRNRCARMEQSLLFDLFTAFD